MIQRVEPIVGSQLISSTTAGPEVNTITHNYSTKNVLEIKNAIVWPYLGIAGDAKRGVIRETCSSDYRLKAHVRLGAFRGGRAKREERLCCAIESGIAFENHYHWLVDALPRIWALHKLEREFSEEIVLYLCRLAYAEVGDLLRSLLPANVIVENVHPQQLIKANRFLHLPCLSEDFCGWLPPDFLEFFRHRAKSYAHLSAQEPDVKIFISRSKANKRRIINEVDLWGLLEKEGFIRVHMEELSLEQQICLFNRASHVISAHGAGLSNLIFSQQVRVLELFASDPVWHYRWLSQAANHRYSFLCGDASEKNSDFNVSLSDVAGALNQLR